MFFMSATCPPGRLADVGPERLAGPPAVCPVLPQIRTSLELFRDSLLDLSRRLERPILEVGAFLEAIQELESGKPTAEAGSRLVVALQSYDLFHQKRSESVV